MRIYLLPEHGNFYKVNMHSHSTLSDGKQTPEELKELYMAKGYSAIAFTEHGKIHDLTHLTDESFVAITSYEIDFLDKEHTPFPALLEKPLEHAHMEAVHMNLYAYDPHNVTPIDLTDLKVPFSLENVNEAVRRAREAGFFVIYNHPHWSMNTHGLYAGLKDVQGLELVNGASNRSSDLDYAPYVYDEMVAAGLRPICVGGDDNHVTSHFFQAWTVMKADELTHDALLGAMKAGNCYASTGPEIYDLYAEISESGEITVTIRTSPATGIYCSTITRRRYRSLADENGGKLLTEATFKINPNDLCFRLSVRDERGEHANTRMFFLDELAAK